MLAALAVVGCDASHVPLPGASGDGAETLAPSGYLRPGVVPSPAPVAGGWAGAAHEYLVKDLLRVHVHRETGARVMNRAGMRAVFDLAGVALVAADVGVEEVGDAVAGNAAAASAVGSAWGIRYRLEGLSKAAGDVPLAAGRIRHDVDRVSIDHGDLVVEEYENLPEGLEQRFYVSRGSPGDLVLRGALEGTGDVQLSGGALVILRGGREVLRATAPRAWDGGGIELEAHFRITPGHLDIVVRGAKRYPVLVDPAWTSSGDDLETAMFGYSTSGAGDVNGDGYADVIIGAPGYDTANGNAGKAYLYLGSAAGLSPVPAWTSSGDDVPAVNFGKAVASAGDVDGDGLDDVVIGAPEGTTAPGTAYLFLGTTAPAGLEAAPVWVSSGEGPSSAKFGLSVAGAGDVNDDGFADLIIGAPSYSLVASMNGSGKAYLFLGSAAGPSVTPDWDSIGDDVVDAKFGWSVASAGDVDGDGCDDIVIGAPKFDNASPLDPGKAYLFRGCSPSGPASVPDWTSIGVSWNGAWFGVSVSSGDVNGDGFDDVMVGAHTHLSGLGSGKVYLYPGGPGGLAVSTWEAYGTQIQAAFGVSVSSAGDVNGDGLDDVLVGANGYDTVNPLAGRAFLYLGSTSPTGLSSTATWDSMGDYQAGALYGTAVAGAGDVNGDGYADVLIAAPRYATANDNAGKVYLYLGGTDPSGLYCFTAGTVCADDGNPCTESLCDGQGECVMTVLPDGAVCQDGDVCNGLETCSAGTCTAGGPVSCDDSDPCTMDSCDPVVGCQWVWVCPDPDAGMDSGVPGAESGVAADAASNGSTDAGTEPTPGCASCRVSRQSSTPPDALWLAALVVLLVSARIRQRDRA